MSCVRYSLCLNRFSLRRTRVLHRERLLPITILLLSCEEWYVFNSLTLLLHTFVCYYLLTTHPSLSISLSPLSQSGMSKLPLLLMRVMINALKAFPGIEGVLINLLSDSGLLRKLWNNQDLWTGFIKVIEATKQNSFGLLIQLPEQYLKSVLSKAKMGGHVTLKQSLSRYAQDVLRHRGRVSRGVLDILGL